MGREEREKRDRETESEESEVVGMVEKWLLQVEKQMIKSLRDTIEKVFRKYFGF